MRPNLTVQLFDRLLLLRVDSKLHFQTPHSSINGSVKHSDAMRCYAGLALTVCAVPAIHFSLVCGYQLKRKND